MSSRRLSLLLSQPLLALVWLYSTLVSPLLGANCRFEPSCSVYAREALLQHGALRGSYLIGRRILRCHPWGGSGYDPVPDSDQSDQNGAE